VCPGTELCDTSYSPNQCGCTTDANCTTGTNLFCDTTTNTCASCVPSGDKLPFGEACWSACCIGSCTGGGASTTCGCQDDTPCTMSPPDVACDVTTAQCVACVPSGHTVHGTGSHCITDCCSKTCGGGPSTTCS
jgi:hypothetical protein